MPKPDPRPAGAALPAAPEAAAPPAQAPAAAEPAQAAALAHYLVVADLPDVADAGRVLRASPARVRAWLDASAVRIATPREIELAAPCFVVLED